MLNASVLPLNRPRLAWVVLVILVVAQGGVAVIPQAPEWFGWAPATGGEFERATTWGSGILCLVACWFTSHPRVHGYADLTNTGSRGVAAIGRTVLIYVVSAGVIGYLLTLLGMTAAPAAFGVGLEGSWRTLLLSALTVLISAGLWTAMGIVLGRSLPPLPGVLMAGVGPFAIQYAVVAIGFYGQGAFDAFLLGSGRVFSVTQPTLSVWVLRSLFWAALAAATMFVVLGRRRARLGALWSTSVAAALIMLTGFPMEPIPGAEQARCRGERPTVCTDRARAAVLPDYALETGQALQRLPSAARPVAVVQSPELVPGALQRSFVLVAPPMGGHTEPAATLTRDRYLARLGRSLFGVDCLTGAGVRGQNADVADVLELWWRREFALPLTDFPGQAIPQGPESSAAQQAARAFAELSPAVRDRWLAENVRDLAACTDRRLELP